MLPQITKRRVGDALVIELRGSYTGGWAVRGKEKLTQVFKSERGRKIVLNLQKTESLDTLGVKSLFQSIPSGKELAVVCASFGTLALIRNSAGSRKFHLFRNEAEMRSQFAAGSGAEKGDRELRGSSRLQSMFPLEFSYDAGGEQVEMKGVVTNINESGIFAEYVDSKSDRSALRRFDPYEADRLYLRILLPHRKAMEGTGVVTRLTTEGGQIGVGIRFVALSEENRKVFQRLLKQYELRNEFSTV